MRVLALSACPKHAYHPQTAVSLAHKLPGVFTVACLFLMSPSERLLWKQVTQCLLHLQPERDNPLTRIPKTQANGTFTPSFLLKLVRCSAGDTKLFPNIDRHVLASAVCW